MCQTLTYNKIKRICPVDGRENTYAHKVLQFYSPYLDIEEYGIFNQTIENEVYGLENRHLRFGRPIAPADLALLQGNYQKLADSVRNIDYRPLTFQELIKDKRGPLKKRYKIAHDSLKNGESVRHKVESFVKIERFTNEKLSSKPPRLIQHRSYEFVYLLNKYLQPIDKAFQRSEEYIDGQRVGTFFGKSKPQAAIAQQIVDAWEEFSQPVALCVDQSNFDGHYTDDMHRGERMVYDQFTPVKDNIGYLLNFLQGACKARTQHGVEYEVMGERCSGEYNTSMGNSLTNIAIIKSVLELCGIIKSRIIVNGDDSIIIIEHSDLNLFNINYFSRFSMDAKLDVVAYSLEEIEFCQCSPVQIKSGWTMVRKPSRVIGKACLMIGPYKNAINRWLMSIGLCEMALSKGVPILQEFSLALITLANGARPLDNVGNYSSRYEPALDIMEITPEARESFERAFNISLIEQLCIERDLREIVNSGQDLQNILSKYKNFHTKIH